MPFALDGLERRVRALNVVDRDTGRSRAAVAVVLREGAGGLEVLLIRRAERARDPWSGHAAFPGGRAEEGDASIVETAIRETGEEIGLDLRAAGVRLLGRLPAVHARVQRDLAVTPVLFEISGDPPLSPDPREVAATVWVPLELLGGGGKRGWLLRLWRPIRWAPVPIPLLFPCWRTDGLVIWGLTYRTLAAVIELLEGD